jgi:predicted dehydrogenase
LARKIGTAVIGLGSIGPVHTKWYSEIPESRLIAVCDVREKIVEELAAKYNVRAYTDYHELLEDREVEAVTICPPNFLHAPIAIEAAKRGKHIAVEKPLCLNLGEADRMISAVKKSGVYDQYLENLCFAPSYSLAKEIIDKGGLGNVYYCKARESGDIVKGSEREKQTVAKGWQLDPKKSGGGMLMDTGIHAVQFVRYIFDKAPALRVHAEIIDSIGLKKPKGIEDAAFVTIRFRGNRIGIVDTSLYATGGGCDDTAEIYGDRGTVYLDLYRRNPIRVHSHAGYSMLAHSMFNSSPGDDRGWSYPIPEEHYALGYFHEQRHFLQSIIANRRPQINLDDGRAALEIVLAAYKSHETGKSVSLPLS